VNAGILPLRHDRSAVPTVSSVIEKKVPASERLLRQHTLNHLGRFDAGQTLIEALVGEG
jgi:hypothetical protein